MAQTAKAERKTKGTGIRSRLTAQMLLVGLAPLVVLGALGYFALRRTTDTFDRNLQESAQLTLTNAAKDLVGQLDVYMEERVRDVLTWASDPAIVDAAVRADAAARQQAWPGYPDIARQPETIKRIEVEMAGRAEPEPRIRRRPSTSRTRWRARRSSRRSSSRTRAATTPGSAT